MRHEEYDIRIRAASGTHKLCTSVNCDRPPEFDLIFSNDAGDAYGVREDLCPRHVLLYVVEEITR